MEKWKDIDEYEGLYQVSNLGRVKSLKFGRERILKAGINSKGYLTVVLCKNGKEKGVKVHRLVANAFVPNPNNLPEVNHKDENKENNNFSNLEWCTTLYNIQYSKAKKIKQYDKQGNFIKEWDCMSNVEKKLKINTQNISACCKNKRSTAGGYIWKYKDAS